MHAAAPVRYPGFRNLIYALLEVGLAGPAGFVVVGGCVDRENPESSAD
jgi:hypothetical protein